MAVIFSLRVNDGEVKVYSNTRPEPLLALCEEDACRQLLAFPALLSLVRTYWQSRSEERWQQEEPEIHAAILAVLRELGMA